MVTNQPAKENTTTTSSTDAEAGDTQRRETRSEGYTITIPSLSSMGSMGTSTASEVVEPKHLAWFGALAIAGAAGVIEWPVIAAIGLGTVVAERFARSGNRSRQSNT
jgi:hypothetical protein